MDPDLQLFKKTPCALIWNHTKLFALNRSKIRWKLHSSQILRRAASELSVKCQNTDAMKRWYYFAELGNARLYYLFIAPYRGSAHFYCHFRNLCAAQFPIAQSEILTLLGFTKQQPKTQNNLWIILGKSSKSLHVRSCNQQILSFWLD